MLVDATKTLSCKLAAVGSPKANSITLNSTQKNLLYETTKKRGLASSETLHSMDAVAKAPWMGLRRVSDGARPLLHYKLKFCVLR